MKSYARNIFAGCILIVLSLIYLHQSLLIRPFRGAGSTPVNSAHMPRFWGACMLLLSTILLIRGIREMLKARSKEGKKEKRKIGVLEIRNGAIAFFKEHYGVILTFTALIVYLALLDAVGFLIISALYIIAQICILSRQITKKTIIYSVIVGIASSVFVSYVFTMHLRVMLPRGILSF